MSTLPLTRDILLETQVHVLGCMRKQMPSAYYFHHTSHTLEVVHQCEELAKAIDLPWKKTHALILAAWFHDLGYIGGSEDHEKRGATMATAFLSQFPLETSNLELVQTLIYSTRRGTEPKTVEEKILHDANTSYLASSRYMVWSQMLKQESQAILQKEITDKEWHLQRVEVFTAHQYFTAPAQQRWNETKREHLELVRLLATQVLTSFTTNPFMDSSTTEFSQN